MDSLFTIAPRLLRNPAAYFESVRRGKNLQASIRWLLVSSVAYLSIYGFVMGMAHSPWQALSSSVKMPILFIGAGLLCLPALYLFALVMGTQLRLAQVTALVLAGACTFFPADTVHLAVVDPGVGTRRRPLAMRLGRWLFVGPDNGLFSPVLEQAEREGWEIEAVLLANPDFWLPAVSRTFHGRDLFAPVAAHLARGVRLADLGPALADPIRLQIPRPEKTVHGWRAHVLSRDAFGNLATDLAVDQIAQPEAVRVRVGSFEIRGLVPTYGSRPRGELVALADSRGRLEIAVVDGSAAQVTGLRVGDEVAVVVK